MAYKEKSPIPVVEGGTGVQTVAAHSLIIGEGTSGFANTGAGTAGQVVLSGGASADPAYVTPSAGSGLSVTANATTLSWGINAPVSVANGGTGDTSLTAYAVLCGGTTTTSAIQSIASVGSSGNILTSNGASALPTFQAPAASSISITGNTGGALTGNAFTFSGGTTGLSFGGSGTTETLTFAGITANAGTVSIGTDALDNSINLGTAANAGRMLHIGNTTGTTSTIISAGSNGLVLHAGGGFTLDSTASAQINISNDANAATVNLGSGAAVKGVTIGSTNSTSTTTVQSGTGALNITATNGPLTIKSGTGTLAIANDASANTVNIATGAAVKTTTLGSTNSTSATTVQSGSGALNVTSTNGVLTMNTGTGQINISSDATATEVAIGTGLGTKTINIGSTSGSSSVSIISGSAGVQLNFGPSINSSGIATNGAQPAFLAYLATSVSSVTGDGTAYTVLFDTKLYDNDVNYATGTGIFTSPAAGKYIFTLGLELSGLLTANNSTVMTLVTSGHTYGFNVADSFTASVSGSYSGSASIMVAMALNDTAKVVVTVSGGTKVVNVVGSATSTTLNTYFSGYLAC